MQLVVHRDGAVQRFAVTLDEGATVLQALDAVRADQDGTLTYRCACRHGMCGACAMRIQGRPALACVTLLADVEEDGVVEVAPLAGLAVLRDLVVDLDPFFEAYERAKPWVEPVDEQPGEHRMSPEEVEEMEQADHCLACGACASVCPVVALTGFAFDGPAALLKTRQRLVDPRDTRDAERLRAAGGPMGAFRCRSALACTEACPAGLNPARAIGQLRRELLGGER